MILFPATVWTGRGQSRLDSIQRIGEVVITAGRYREVIPVQRLTGKRLETLGSFSVADAVRYFAGVQLKDYGGIGGLKTIDIRSMGSHHTGVFYDGLPLGNAQNGQVDLGKFSLDNIEEVTLYNGQRSEILQPARDFGSAGSIYLRTAKPRFEEGRRSRLKASFRTGSFGLLNPSVIWEQHLGKNTAGSLNAEYVHASGRYRFRYRKVLADGTTAWDTTAIRENGDIRSTRLEGGLHGGTDAGIWHLKGYYYASEKGIPGAIVNNVWKHSQRQWDGNAFVQGSFRRQFGRRYELMANAKYANDRMRYLNPDTTLMYIDNTFRQQEIYTSLAQKYAILDSWDVSLSTDYQWNTLDASLKGFAHPVRHTALIALAIAAEWRHFKAQGSLLGAFIRNYTDATGQAPATIRNRREYTPAFFLSYRPTGSAFNLRAFYKRIFRMPTFNDLYYTDIGNAVLRPEYTVQYNLGIHYRREHIWGVLAVVEARTDFYYNEVTDKIIAVPKGNSQYRWMMMNLGYVEIRGADVSGQLTWRLPSSIFLQTSLTYTYQRAQDFTDPTDNTPSAGTYGGQIAYIPWHSGSFIANVTRGAWSLNYSFIYVGERYHNSSNIRENHEQPWYTHDLTLSTAFRLAVTRYRLSAEVNNLLNQSYDVILNYPMPGRNYKLILKIEI
jgi:outer membrane cobalamin receptor